jgi:hypothetical protein
MAHNVKIKIRAFPYYEEVEDPVTGRTVRREHVATRGEEVELSDADYERALRFAAIEGTTADATPEGDGTVSSDDPASLAEWIKSSKPTVDETVDAAEDDPERAAKLLEAENLATGEQPRRGVVEGLNEIIKDKGD